MIDEAPQREACVQVYRASRRKPSETPIPRYANDKLAVLSWLGRISAISVRVYMRACPGGDPSFRKGAPAVYGSRLWRLYEIEKKLWKLTVQVERMKIREYDWTIKVRQV